MSFFEDLKPSVHGLYKVEVLVEGKWMSTVAMTQASIEALSDRADELSDADIEASLPRGVM